MKNLARFTLLAVATLLVAPAVFAQAPDAAAGGTNWVAITSGFAMALAAAFCGIGQSKVASAACEGIARNPGASDAMFLPMILGLVFTETLALFTLLIVFTKV